MGYRRLEEGGREGGGGEGRREGGGREGGREERKVWRDKGGRVRGKEWRSEGEHRVKEKRGDMEMREAMS